jgi:hypothetical protein
MLPIFTPKGVLEEIKDKAGWSIIFQLPNIKSYRSKKRYLTIVLRGGQLADSVERKIVHPKQPMF